MGESWAYERDGLDGEGGPRQRREVLGRFGKGKEGKQRKKEVPCLWPRRKHLVDNLKSQKEEGSLGA